MTITVFQEIKLMNKKPPTQKGEILFRHGKASLKGQGWTGVAADGRRYVRGFHIAKKTCSTKITKEIRKAIIKTDAAESLTKREKKILPAKKKNCKKV